MSLQLIVIDSITGQQKILGIDELIELIADIKISNNSKGIILVSSTSNKSYRLGIDDIDPLNPKIKLIQII